MKEINIAGHSEIIIERTDYPIERCKSILDEEVTAILGYGPQGRGQGLNMRDQGFKVILDLVANHTAWDNELAKPHPDWYEKDWKGDFRPTPWWDWSDIIDLDWSKPGVREHVGGAMEYWVREKYVP